ncbi:MAG: hypothetical protein JRD89_15845 [Deltaproteobacteria bacterium]|nr:hypothetical protein [Deltaproteobacteria bacterium]
MGLLHVLGGLVIGIVVGMFVLSGPAMAAAMGGGFFLMLGVAALTFVGGLLIGRRTSPKIEPVKFSWRPVDR